MKAKIKLMLLAIQNDNFDQFQTYFKQCKEGIDSKFVKTPSDIINTLRSTSEDSAVHIAAKWGRLSILRYVVCNI